MKTQKSARGNANKTAAGALDGLRQKAADAALHWVMSHQDRVAAFRRSVKGTPLEKAVSGLLDLIKSEAKGVAKAKPAARRGKPRPKAPARKRPARRKAG